MEKEEAVPPELGGHVSEWDVRDSKLLERQGVAQPLIFCAEAHNWYEWKLRFQSVMPLLGILPAMRYVADLPFTVEFRLLNAEGQHTSALLYNLLVQP
eukprot:6329677-Heterocapsa_arctica.AAC.1